jgi:hypothetical protein
MSDPFNSNPFQVVKHEGYFQRLGNSFGGIVGGFVAIFGFCALLWWNEGRAVEASTGLADALQSVIALTDTNPATANDGKLVHMTGEAKAIAPIADPDLKIEFPGALKVTRKSEMYQWVEETKTETRENLGGSKDTITTYAYKRDWSSTPVDSSRFNREAAAAEGRRLGVELVNPPMKVEGKPFVAGDAKIGGFILKPVLVAQLSGDAVPKPSAEPQGWTPDGAGYYRGLGNSGAPKIGDMRVSYIYLPSPQQVSVLARQQGASLEPWRAPNDYEVYRASVGDKTARMMISDQQSAENVMTWILRGVGIFGICIGFSLILAPLRAIANVVPFIAHIIQGGIWIIAVALGVPLGLIIIALAWLAHRPILGIGLLVAAAAIIWWFGWGRRRQAAAPQAI